MIIKTNFNQSNSQLFNPKSLSSQNELNKTESDPSQKRQYPQKSEISMPN